MLLSLRHLRRLDIRVCRHDTARHLEERVKVVLDVLRTAAPVLVGVVEHGRTDVVVTRRIIVFSYDVLLLAAEIDTLCLTISAFGPRSRRLVLLGC